MAPRPGVLLVLDGWGAAAPSPANAVAQARTPVLDGVSARCPSTLLEASGEAVGLPAGAVGNSEIGHLVIGAGRPLPYDSLLVQRAVDSGELRRHPGLAASCRRLADGDRALHLIGLCSTGQIHADVSHVRELLEVASTHGVPRVWIHAITDGRDVPDGTAGLHLAEVERLAGEVGIGQIACVIGRGYAMDKSGDLAVTRKAVAAIADASGVHAASLHEALALSGRGDEWVPPTVVTGSPAAAPVQDGDTVLFFNFRSDRISQLADALLDHVGRTRVVDVWSLAEYDTRTPVPALVSRADASGGLRDVLTQREIRSVRIAEPEKFEHVTFYINGRTRQVSHVEEHLCIEGGSAPDYRSHPEMNVAAVAEAVVAAASRDEVALVLANLANIDVIGHTGDAAATRRAVEHVDAAVGRVLEAARAAGRWVLLVGDHGNGEVMAVRDADGRQRPYGGHTTNPVPLTVVPGPGAPPRVRLPAGRSLADVAPTVLTLLGCPPSPEMSGRSLL